MDAESHAVEPPIADCGALPLLPATAFERFMLADDQPAYPMTYYVKLAAEGTLDVPALRRAVEWAALRNPLLHARLEKGRRSVQWRFVAECSPVVDWLGCSFTDAPPRGATIDLTHEPGVRLWCGVENGLTAIGMQFHHAATDGMGARRFIVDFLTGYANLTADRAEPVRWDRLDPGLLVRRGELPALKASTGTSAWEKLRNMWEFHTRVPAPLAASTGVDRSNRQVPLLQWHSFDEAESSQLRETACGLGVSLNDVGVTLLFRTLADWNREHSTGRSSNWLRILVPTDLRTRADVRMPATNRLGFAFLTRPLDVCDREPDLLSSAHAEMSYIKTNTIGLDFVLNIGLLQHVPGLLPAILRYSGCQATAVLTNLGDTGDRFYRRFPRLDGRTRVGNLTPVWIAAVPPIRPGTRAGFGLCIYGGRLALGLLADHDSFDTASTRQLLDAYIRQWRNWASGCRSETTRETTVPRRSAA